MRKTDIALVLLKRIVLARPDQNYYTCGPSYIRRGQLRTSSKYNLLYLSDPSSMAAARMHDLDCSYLRSRSGPRKIKAIALVKTEDSLAACVILTNPKIYRRCKRFFDANQVEVALVTAKLCMNR
ncbi:MAG: hypothetical protein NTV33_10980 [Coprothermobacterota bacterium]|nr:hypothetical protein [Coprothermobacterota bacterium]